MALFARAGTPARFLESVNRDGSAIAASPELKRLLESDGMTPAPLTPAGFSARIKQELAQWKQIAGARRISVE